MAANNLTFSEREGLVELPVQLQLGEISKPMRAQLWKDVRDSFQTTNNGYRLSAQWSSLIEDYLIKFASAMLDDNLLNYKETAQLVKGIFEEGDYDEILDFVEFLYRHPMCSEGLRVDLRNTFETSLCAYRFVDDVIVPISEEHEIAGVENALAVIGSSSALGAKTHLSNSAVFLREGKWAGSIRESITAVESVARSAAPGTKDLKSALNELGKAGYLKHKALQNALNQLYGYTSDEQGIRHALVFKGEADADEAEAVFMFGACASFVSYLLKLSSPEI